MEPTLTPRHLAPELHQALATARVVNVVGPRQSGKTTLVKDRFGRGRFVTLDDPAILAAVEADPVGQIRRLSAEAGEEPVIIDEAQRSKAAALAIKMVVDERRRPGQFVLTGSSNVLTSAQVADSLAGRVRTLNLLPLSAAEIHRQGPARILDWAKGRTEDLATSLPRLPHASREDLVDLVLRGGYPEYQALGEKARQGMYRDYIDTVVDRDVADVLKVRKADALRRLIDQLAARTAGELEIAELCDVLGLRKETVGAYVDVLSRLSILGRLGAWAGGETGREVRRPKLHLLDTGVAAALRSVRSRDLSPDGTPTALGSLLESFVHGELVKNLPYQDDHWRLYHWRSRNGREIDVLAECGSDLVAFEVKASMTVTSSHFRHARWFGTEGPGAPRRVTCLVIYLGGEVLSFGDRCLALPLSVFWAFPAGD